MDPVAVEGTLVQTSTFFCFIAKELTRQLHHQTRRERFRSLVMRALLEVNGLWRTAPRVKSSKVVGTKCFISKGCATKLREVTRRIAAASRISPPSVPDESVLAVYLQR
jgi:hypothetical protein